MRIILALSIALSLALVAGIWLRESGTPQTPNTVKPASVASTNAQPSKFQRSSTRRYSSGSCLPALGPKPGHIAAHDETGVV